MFSFMTFDLFRRYMEYYLKRLKEAPLESFTSSFVVEVPENDSAPREQKYHVLGNSKEDEELRKSLHAKRLVRIFIFSR